MVMNHQVPVQYFTPTLSGVFAVLVTALAALFVGLMVVFVGLLLCLPFFGFVIMATSSAEALHEAEAAKARAIERDRDVAEVTASVSEQSRQTFAPRLMVLRVATESWRSTVSALAGVTSASVIDVSDPTENLMWEMWELERKCPGRWIMIGEHARVARWISDAAAPEPGSLDARFSRMLDARDVLVYTVDRRGMRRFARALYGKLLDLERRSPPSKAAV
jgi:hypothetical protein